MPRVQVNSLTVDYCEAGTGLPIIFIPGITEFKEAFVFQFRGLRDRYRVISYDVRRGLKRTTDYTLELLVRDLATLMDALRLDSAVIVGHSFGSLIAIEFALRYPEKTKALILVAALAGAPDMSPERLLIAVSSASHPLHRSLGARVRMRVARLLGARADDALTMQDAAAAIRLLAHQAEATPPSTISQRMRIIQKTDLRPALSAIASPTLVVVGSSDVPIFLASAQELHEGIADSTLEVIENSGHLCFLTRHDRFNAALDEFLLPRMSEIA